MKRSKTLLALLVAAVTGFSAAQFDLGDLLKVGGVALVVDRFGPDMNKGLNKLTKHKDSAKVKTKVVPILSVGIGRSSAIGAAQVMGPPALIDKTRAVAAPEAELFGKEIRLRGLLPVSDKAVDKGIKIVDGVGVSGIVDIKL